MEGEHTSSIPDEVTAKPPKNLLSRFWHLGTAVVYFALTIVALVCVITFALFDRSFTKEAYPFNSALGPELGKCILFAYIKDLDINGRDVHLIALSSGTLGASCAFNTWGEVVVLLAGVALLVVSLVKAAIGVKAFNALLFVEFAVIVLMGILALIISSLFSAGINTTCATGYNFLQKYGPDEPISDDCSQYFFYKDEARSGTVYFYQKVHTAQTTAWIIFCIFAVLSVVYIVQMCLFFAVRKRRSQPPPYSSLYPDVHADKEESMKSVHSNSD